MGRDIEGKQHVGHSEGYARTKCTANGVTLARYYCFRSV